MGFDAIWISPIPVNYPGGYHGYWQTNFFEVNPQFGTEQDLLDLVQAAHSKGVSLYVKRHIVLEIKR
jgi:alpha-amylase